MHLLRKNICRFFGQVLIKKVPNQNLLGKSSQTYRNHGSKLGREKLTPTPNG